MFSRWCSEFGRSFSTVTFSITFATQEQTCFRPIDHSVVPRHRGCCLSLAERLPDLTSSRSGGLVLAPLDCCLSGDFPDRTVALRLRPLQSCRVPFSLGWRGAGDISITCSC